MTVPRLIEVALPIREISAESVRDKSLRHGHISTLHLWFARRPLAASRAVVFASLVPDPDHPECPQAFRTAVEKHLKKHVPDVLMSYRRGKITHMDPDPYRPYDGQADTLRNRLLAFIAKWSPEWLAFEAGKSKEEPASSNMLDDRSLVKWETCVPTTKDGSKAVPNVVGQKVLWIARELVRIANGNQIPTVLDPFSGGGAIPLEVGRVGAQAIAHDYNPVAYLILRATCEFPQKYGKPGIRKATCSLTELQVPNVLAYDVEHYATEIIRRAKEKLDHLYPLGADKKPVIGYLWARMAPCANPSCKADMPLLSNLLLSNKPAKKVALTLDVKDKTVLFGVSKGKAVGKGDGTMLFRGDCRCPVCGQVTSVQSIRQAGLAGQLGEQMVAVIIETASGKDYRSVEQTDIKAAKQAQVMASTVERPAEFIRPEVTTSETRVANRGDITVHLYGFKTWGSMFNARQIVELQTLASYLRDVVAELATLNLDPDYQQAVTAYLGLWLSRVAQHSNSFCRWNGVGEKMQHIFGRQAISMIWDYIEVPAFASTAGSPINLLQTVIDFIAGGPSAAPGCQVPARVLKGDAANLSIETAGVDTVITDPPYFDAIAYADLSDLFYVWLKRGIGDAFPEAFMTPLTPKTDEATALKHRHGGDGEKAKSHFTTKLTGAFAEAKRVCKSGGVVTVMFAHQSTEAWTALVTSLFDAGLNITATYPIDTEKETRMRAMDSSALASSITVVCRPRVPTAPGAFKEVRREIERVVKDSVKRFWDYGFRGADLIVACYGPAVGEFGKYERVERGDGTPVTVPELLQLAREAALKGIAGEFTGDQLSRLYFVWANLYGVAEQPWDDVRLMVQVGGDSENAMDVARSRGLFVVDGSNSRLAVLGDRADRHHLGQEKNDPLIDQLHRAMLFWKAEDRPGLVKYLHGHELGDHAGFWRLAQALFEVMPRDAEDWRLVSAILGERNTLQTEIKRREAGQTRSVAPSLFDNQDE